MNDDMHGTTPPLVIVHNTLEPKQTGLCMGVKSRDSNLKGRNTQDISSNCLMEGHHLIIRRIFGTKFLHLIFSTTTILDTTIRFVNDLRGSTGTIPTLHSPKRSSIPSSKRHHDFSTNQQVLSLLVVARRHLHVAIILFHQGHDEVDRATPNDEWFSDSASKPMNNDRGAEVASNSPATLMKCFLAEEWRSMSSG